MKVRCKHCGFELDPSLSDNEHLWGPPEDFNTSIGAIVCPEDQGGCGKREDFVEWITLTGKTAEPAEREADTEA